jgi:hypothetical protein
MLTLSARLISLGVLSVLALVITAVAMIPHAYATGFIIPPMTISPNPAVAGQPITFSGSTSGNGASGNDLYLFIFTDTSVAHDCSSTTQISTTHTTLSASFTFSFTATVPSPGYYCAGVDDAPGGGVSIGGSFDQSFSATQPIPEYPIGLPILAIFMIFGYAVIKRKTRN